jgi:hypothetical protein
MASEREVRYGLRSVAASHQRSCSSEREALAIGLRGRAERMAIVEAEDCRADQLGGFRVRLHDAHGGRGRPLAEFLDEDAAMAAIESGVIEKAPRRRRTKS